MKDNTENPIIGLNYCRHCGHPFIVYEEDGLTVDTYYICLKCRTEADADEIWICLKCRWAKYALERDPLAPDYDHYAHFLIYCQHPKIIEENGIASIDGPYCGKTFHCYEFKEYESKIVYNQTLGEIQP
jgi:hypothetical protein